MSLAAGGRLGPYDIISAIGAGGMGEVYRGRDARLQRDVAIKVLPDLFANDPERLTRFQREAQVLASLNHPNIAQVYGIESGALVMEYVDGEDLSAAIARGPMPLGDVLAIARQIADALEAAHEHGVIHRDLKPANIKLRGDGTIKVLDFGLAKAIDPGASTSDAAMHSPTLTARATQLGVIIGTAAYMAPEQARGKAVDKRADIWAFGAVVFELLTGKRLFAGAEVTDVLARILERDPDWSALPAATPPAVRRLLERCLAKDVRMRLRDIGEARHLLDEVIAGRSGSSIMSPAAAAAPAASSVRGWLPWLAAAVFAAIAAYAWWGQPRAAAGPRKPTRVELRLPDGVEFYSSPRISMDGRRIAFVGTRDGARQVFLRDLDQAEARPVPGTDNAIYVALSPDAKSAAIVAADAHLKRVNLEAGGTEDLASDVDVVGGLTWTPNDRILFGRIKQLMSMSAGGGTPTVIVKAETPDESLTGPMTTPDGRTLIFTSLSGPPGEQRPRIEAIGMDGTSRHVVLQDAGYAQAVTATRLTFQRETSIHSAPFDSSRAVVTGPAVKLTDEARVSPTGGIAADISVTGDIIFADVRSTTNRLAWVTLEGAVERAVAAPARPYNNPRVSPDGRSIAYTDSASIWVADTARGSQTRIFSGLDVLTGYPVWSPDGSHLYFRSAGGVMRIRPDGEGKPEAIPGTKRNDYPNGVSPDGSILVTTRIEAATSGDVMLVPTAGGEPRALVATAAYEGGAQFSPNGKWITYVSNTSGRMEIYLRPVNGEERFAVSTSGGLGPIWSPDGRHIYFRNGLQFLAVDVTTEPSVTLSAPRVLFERRYSFGSNLTIANYSLSHDGSAFLVVTTAPSHLSLIFNWLENAGR